MTAEIHPFHQLLISLALGLLVGLQRQWVEAPLAGIRTFSLISVFGTVCAFIANRFGGWILVSGFVALSSVIFVSDLTLKKNFDTTKHAVLSTEVGMFLMYGIGILVVCGPIWLAAASSGILAIVLQSKIELHQLVSRFTDKEIKAFMQFVLISLVVLPLVPNQPVDSLGVLNPREIWLIVILIVGISLTSYIIYKFFGNKAGIILGGILGGVISSTATTASYGRRCKESSRAVSQSAVIISLSWTVVYIRLMLEVAVVAPSFKSSIFVPLIFISIVSFCATTWLWFRSEKKENIMPVQQNPSELKTALLFGVIYATILFCAAATKKYFGVTGLMVTGFISGVTDLDAITLSISRLVDSGKLLNGEGTPVILIAILSNLLFKTGIATFLGGRLLFKVLAVPLVASLLAIIGLLLMN